jgi:hypothetical protein
MGALASRVRTLQDAVLRCLGSALLRSGGRGPGLRVHLVGHSTGGLDARLLANPRYHFEGEDREARAQLLRHLGTVVTLSAPHHGTPLARSFLRLLPRLALEAMSAATIMASARGLGRRLELPGAGLPWAIFRAVWPRSAVNGQVVDLLTGMDVETARQIARFRGMVMSDTGMLRDLAPERMTALNERLGAGRTPLVEIATVAPRPSLTRGGLEALGRRAAYAVCYSAASSGEFRPRHFPEGPWLSSRGPGAEREGVEDAPRANDGVVPASSQTMDGHAARVVLADHLDVIGHFESRRNTTLFKSGARFGPREFVELWRFVAEAL